MRAAAVSGRARARMAWLAPCLVLVALPAAAASPTSPITPDECRTQVQALLAAVNANEPSALAAATRGLPAAWHIRAGDQQITLPTGWLRVDLDELRFKPTPEIRGRVEAELRKLDADLDAWAGPPPDRSRDRRELRAILARREFSSVHGPTWFDRLKRRVSELLASLVEKIFGSSSFPVVAEIVIYVLVGLALLVTGLWVYRTLAGGQPAQAVPARVAVSAKPWTAWLAEAREAAAAGRWRDAVRLAYWAGISCLESRGVWPPDRARTPREYLRLLPASSEHRQALSALTRTFEPVWYGGRGADATTFARAVDDLARLGAVWSKDAPGARAADDLPAGREKAQWPSS